MADEAGVETGREVHAVDERVEREHELRARRRRDERRVVADAGEHVFAPRAAPA